MTASPLIIPVARFFTISGGAALAGGKVYTYEAGTNTPKATYTDFSGDTENTNPVILDSSGQANIWLNGNYKINLLDSNNVQQPNYPVDNVSSYSTGSISEYAVTTGSANNYILTPSPAITEYTPGQVFNIKINVTNTGPSTINVSNLGAKSIVRPTASALVGGELVVGSVYRIVYDGTNFQLEGLLYNPTGPLSTIASATTTDLGSVSTHLVLITGTTTITSFGSSAVLSNPFYFIRFSGILTLTHNGTSLIIPGSANITTANGDTAIVEYLGSGNWKVHEYTRITALPLVTIPIASGGTGQTTAMAAFDALKQAATDIYAGVVEKATQAEMASETADKYPDASLIKYSPGVVKAWITFNGVGGISIGAAYNASVVRNNTGDYTVTFSPAFSDANYAFSITAGTSGVDSILRQITSKTSSTLRFITASFTPVNADAEFISVEAWHL